VNNVCVYCGSNSGRDPLYTSAAQNLATELASRGHTLIYGGGNVGLMGVMANTMLANGGRAIGVIPHQLAALELAHEGLTDLHVVSNMHERKAKMAELADAVIALPGGMGTMEEMFEALTWTQLGIHAKPCGLVNTGGYYDHLLAFLDTAVEQQFVRAVHRNMLQIDDNAANLLDKLASVTVPADRKWITDLERNDTSNEHC
jgi:uncharacterized protein (TIGR00730 family)